MKYVIASITDHLDNFKNPFEGTSPCPGDLVLAFYSVSFTYSGWYEDMIDFCIAVNI